WAAGKFPMAAICLRAPGARIRQPDDDKGSFSNPDSMRFHDEQLTAIETLLRIGREESYQSLHKRRNYLWMIFELHGDDTDIAGGRISKNFAEIPVEREQYSSQFLSFCNHNRIE